MVFYLILDYAKFRKCMDEEYCPKTPYDLVLPPVSIVEDLPDFCAPADRVGYCSLLLRPTPLFLMRQRGRIEMIFWLFWKRLLYSVLMLLLKNYVFMTFVWRLWPHFYFHVFKFSGLSFFCWTSEISSCTMNSKWIENILVQTNLLFPSLP